jgi:hypothetical protein
MLFGMLVGTLSASVAVLCALMLGLRDGAMACAGVWVARFRLHGPCAERARFVWLRSFGTGIGVFAVLGFLRA